MVAGLGGVHSVFFVDELMHSSSFLPLSVSLTRVTGGAVRCFTVSTIPNVLNSLTYSCTVFHRNPSSSAILEIGLGSLAIDSMTAFTRLSVSAILPTLAPSKIGVDGLSDCPIINRLHVESKNLNTLMFKRLNGELNYVLPGDRLA